MLPSLLLLSLLLLLLLLLRLLRLLLLLLPLPRLDLTAVRTRAVGDFVQEIHGQPKLPTVVHHSEGGSRRAIEVRGHQLYCAVR